MATYFISDIHLDANSKEQANMLYDFLRTTAKDADALYILGDLFAIWLGDDLREPYSEELISALRDLVQSKVPVYFMHGNRDFLVGKKFCQASGCALLPDPCKINLYGKDILLTHGDQLCTLDIKYQRFRRVVQNPILNQIFLRLPIDWRKKIGKLLSKKSRGTPQDPATYDVEAKTAEIWFNKHGVATMIHGHTHKPDVHHFDDTVRIVLGDWQPNYAKILKATATSFDLQNLSSEPAFILSGRNQ